MHLILFFTKDMSLVGWDRAGILNREITPYQRLVLKGHDINFITYGNIEDLNYINQLGDIRVLCNKWGLPKYIYNKYLHIIHRKYLKSCNIIKTNQIFGADIALKSAKYYKKPLINRMGYLLSDAVETLPEFNHFDLNKIYKMQDFVFNQASKIVVTTNRIANTIEKMNPLFKNKTEVIPNYVDTVLFSPKNDKNLYDILFIGRFSHQKNILNFLESVKGMSLNILFIGNGSLENQIRESVENSNNNFKWITSVNNSEIPKYMNQSKLFVLPSYYEGHPKVLIEAMSCEMLVLASNVDGNNSIIEDGVNGFLCGTDSESIRAVIDSIFKIENAIIPSINLYGNSGNKLFTSFERNLNHLMNKAGFMESIVWIPDNLFSNGQYSISLTFFYPIIGGIARIITTDKILSFTVLDEFFTKFNRVGNQLYPKYSWEFHTIE